MRLKFENFLKNFENRSTFDEVMHGQESSVLFECSTFLRVHLVYLTPLLQKRSWLKFYYARLNLKKEQ